MKQVTAKDIERMLIDALAEHEDCRGVKTISVSNRFPKDAPPYWDVGIVNFGDADSTLCKAALPQIVAKLQSEYELIVDDA